MKEFFKGVNFVDLELRNFNGFIFFYEVVFVSCFEVVRCLVNYGVNVNCKVLVFNSKIFYKYKFCFYYYLV